MFKTGLVVFVCLLAKNTHAQYYFQDIVTAGRTQQLFNQLKTNNIRSVVVSSIEPDGSETEDFGISQQVDASRNQLTTFARSSITGSSVATTLFNAAGLPIKLVDSSANTVNTANYQYNAEGKLLKISSTSREPNDTNHYTFTEEHIFQYNTTGVLVGMLRIKDGSDTLKVVFRPAEKGLPGVEEWWKGKRKTETWYYYYDTEGRLSDVVRFDLAYQKMKPDYVFEYNDQGLVSQQTVVQPGTSFYRVWVYDYDERGLKKSETIFHKGKEQEGRILYEYN